MIDRSAIEAMSYEENYDLIARTHVDSYWAGNGNPWMPENDINYFHSQTARLVAKYADESAKILDAGCGIGELAVFIDPDAYEYTGLDLAESYLEVARTRTPGHEFVQGKLEALPFPNEHFDMVLCTDVLEHVLHLDDAVRELLRVLKPEGILIARVPLEVSIQQYVQPSAFKYIHVRRFDEADLILLFYRCFDCEIVMTELLDGSVGNIDIHCVVRKP